jgi:uncharacterized protein (TIGR03084 family)
VSHVELVADLEDEQRGLRSLLEGLDDDAWLTPTPSWSWDVRDTIAHLAHTDDVALDTMTGGPSSLGALAERGASPEDVTYLGVLAGRRMRGPAVLAWWARSSAAECAALRALAPDVRVPWGLGMAPRSFVTARLMETWAHGLDVHAALGVPQPDTPRLRHVAWLAVRALPYAYGRVGRQPPPGELRVELDGPDGVRVELGPPDAPNRITGDLGDLCRVFVQRLPVARASLHAEGDAAVAALEVARAYL